MGLGYSTAFQFILHSPKYHHWSKIFDAMTIKKSDLYQLYQIYGVIDTDKGGSIDINEFISYLELANTPFSRRVFSIFDEDHSGEIDFFEFVVSVWNYCTLSKYTLVMFAFDMYDKHGKGYLSLEAVETMCKEIYGKTSLAKPLHSRSHDEESSVSLTGHHRKHYNYGQK
jgi:Ca2+-binding EF-hand superfamily protein